MADDQTFRLILVVGMAAFLPVALYHRIRSQAGGEKLDRRQEGLFILVTLRLCGLAAMGGLVAFILDPVWMSWASVPLPAALRWVGVAVGVPTVALGIWTFRSLGRNITDTVVTRRAHADNERSVPGRAPERLPGGRRRLFGAALCRRSSLGT